jgi:hypothetical protein
MTDFEALFLDDACVKHLARGDHRRLKSSMWPIPTEGSPKNWDYVLIEWCLAPREVLRERRLPIGDNVGS